MEQLPANLRSKIDAHPNGCWLWVGGVAGKGYGYTTGNRYTHRLVYEILVGPIPLGLVLDHLCRTPLCCNPEHLEPVTQLENVLRGRVVTRSHCKYGHEYTEANTYVHHPAPRGPIRSCKTCRREALKKFRARL